MVHCGSQPAERGPWKTRPNSDVSWLFQGPKPSGNTSTLIADFEPKCRSLVAAAGLAWDDRCLRFHEADRVVLTPSRWQVRSPIYAGAVARWKRYEKHIGPLIEELQGEVDG